MADHTDRTGSDGPTDHALQELLRSEHRRAQVDERRRRNELHRQAHESLSLLDVLTGLGSGAALVSVRVRRGLLPPSTVVEVGRDYVALRHGALVRLVPADTVISVRPIGRAAGASPVRSGPADADLRERLAELALRRAPVTALAAGEETRGRARLVGADLVTITAEDGSPVSIALAALDEVAVGP